MFQRLFRKERDQNREITGGVYAAIVAAARQPRLYSDWGVPDTPLGRFEMISLHMILALRRMKQEDAMLHGISQDVTDHFFLEVDHSLRELGVGDVGVPKRMKRLAKMFYGRAASYSEALDASDRKALADALARNVWPKGAPEANPAALAGYAIAAAKGLQAQPAGAWISARAVFPRVDEVAA